MAILPIACLCAAVAAQMPETVEALRRLAATEGSEPALSAVARAQPDSLRAALARTLAHMTAAESEESRRAGLLAARRLARGYADAWADSFLVRDVAAFERWSPAQRRARVAADSLRLAGIDAAGREGMAAAMTLWRAALARVPAVDSAGRAAAMASVGAGFYWAGELDSATVYLARARDLAARIGDLRTRGAAIGILASVRMAHGDLAGAAVLYEEASAVRERTGDRRGIAADRNNVGMIARALGDLDQARTAFERALELNRRDGRRRQVALNLSNLADIAVLRGEYERADRLYREALAINREDGDRAETAYVLHDLGLLAARRGDYASARTLLAEALAIHGAAGAGLETVAVRRDLAAVQAAAGDLQAALNGLDRAEREAAAVPETPDLLAALALTRADLSVQLGAFAEAEDAYARAERLAGAVGDELGLAEARQGRALLLQLRGDHRAALGLLDLAAHTQDGLGDRRAAALTRLLAGHVQRESGDTAEARRTLAEVRETLRSLSDAVGEAAALDAMGRVAARRGAALEAERLYRRGLAVLGDRPASDVRWQLHANLAEALRGRGALGPAAEQLRSAIAGIEEVAGGLRVEERRGGYVADRWKVYAALALIEQQRGRPAEAFVASERMRARQLRDLLARGRVPSRREASAREQDLRRQITDLLEAIEAHGPGLRSPRAGRPAEPVEASIEALARAQREYADLLLDVRARDPAYGELVAGETVAWEAVASRLAPEEAFLAYLVADSNSLVFVVTSDTIHALELGIGRAPLANLVEFARRTMDRPGTSPATPHWRPPLRRLHQHLIEPVERSGLLDGRTRLVIAPHGDLHFLPFAALVGGGERDRFLVERFEIVHAPSATVWVRLGERHVARPAGGVLALAPRTAGLPASRDEVLAIGRIHGPRATVLLESAANKRALREGAANHAVLHIASYGILNKHNPLFSYVELAPADGDDGRLEVHEVYGLALAGQLVVLSACQTALGSGTIGDVPPGDDWVGLVQAFLYAGAGAVVASLWPVEDRATARLMEHFYRALGAGRPEPVALAQAQRAMLRDGGTLHPFHWAGFVLAGGTAPFAGRFSGSASK